MINRRPGGWYIAPKAQSGVSCRLVQLVLIQFLGVWSIGNTCPLRRSSETCCIQGKMHTVKSAEHGYRVIAPQSAVTPNDFLRYAYDPARDACIASVDKFPATPVFLSSWRTRLARSVIGTSTELFFVTIVLLAGEKHSTMHVLSNVGFEGPVFIRA